MQDKKIDYSSLIGSILISIILVGYIYFNKIFDQEKVINVKKSYLSKSSNLIKNSFKSSTKFFNTGKVGETILQNKVLRIKISNLGGEINEVLLKSYKSYDHKNTNHSTNIYLVKPGTFSFGLNFKNLKKEKVSSQSLFFTPNLYENKDYYKLIMKTFLPYGGELSYIYILSKKKDYKLDFNIKSQNILSFAQKNSIYLDWKQKIISIEKNPNWENNYTQIYYSSKNLEKIKYLSENGNDEKILENINWLANKQQFFASIFSLDQTFKKLKIQSKTLNSIFNLKYFQASSPLNLISNEINCKGHWYFVPLNYNLLKEYNKKFEEIIPFGWGIIKWLNKYFFLIIFQLLEKTKLNYGIIIILMTIVVKFILSPITYKQYKLSAMMKVIQPELEKLNKKLKGVDSLKKQRAIMELYQKTGVNPMSGCLPAILQIPIFYALFKFFPTVINLRGKSFLWADDLTSYDSIYHFSFSIPFYGDHISLFTLFYAAALFLYTKISGNNNINQSTQEGIPNMKFITYLMPIIMILFINSYASGLSLYYFLSNIFNIIIIFITKNYILDEEKIHNKIQENKSKPIKRSLWQQKLQNMIKESQKNKIN